MSSRNQDQRDDVIENDSDDDSFIFSDIYINKPFFDWKLAQQEFGLIYSIISCDGFDSFVKDKFCLELVTLRKCYIMRDYAGIRFWFHKFKGSFKLFYSSFISKPCEIIIRSIDKGDTYELENLYCNFVVRMEFFLDKLTYLASATNNEIKSYHLENLKNDFNFCDKLEDVVSFNKIVANRKKYVDGKMNFDSIPNNDQEEITYKSSTAETFCSSCVIL